jgi:chemotaxis protein methyltransferase CheR
MFRRAEAMASAAGSREFEFTDGDFRRLQGLVREHTGISLSDSKSDLVYSRLARRLRALGLGTFHDYCGLLQTGGEELEAFSNASTTNLTAFFREAHHFDYLASEVLTSPVSASNRARRLRIWSAGCSTGEEPYSIAMTVLVHLPSASSWDVRILATDLDSDVLDRARSGIYAIERVESLLAERRHRWFLRGKRERAQQVRVRDEARRLVTFRHLNLMHPWPMQGPFDVIFCRNVVIYFDKEDQRRLFARMAELLPPGGHLLLGHSETLFGLNDRFDLVGKTVYRRLG